MINTDQKDQLAKIAVRFFNNKKLNNSDKRKLMNIGMNVSKKYLNKKFTS